MKKNTAEMNHIHHQNFIHVAIFSVMIVYASARCAAENAILDTPGGNNLITLKQIEAALDSPMPQIDFPGEVPLSEVLQVIATELKKTSSLPIQLLPDYQELQLESIETLEDVVVRDVFFQPQSHTFRQTLEAIFRQTDPELAFLPQEGHILITTAALASNTLTTRVYEISDVIESISGKRKNTRTAYIPAQFGSQRTGNALSTDGPAFQISELLMAATSPPAQWIDIDGEGGVIYIAGNRLAVTQTYAVHRMIEQVLKDLIKPLRVNNAEAAAITTNQLDNHQMESRPNYLLLAFAVVGWVMAFFLAIVAVFASRSN